MDPLSKLIAWLASIFHFEAYGVSQKQGKGAAEPPTRTELTTEQQQAITLAPGRFSPVASPALVTSAFRQPSPLQKSASNFLDILVPGPLSFVDSEIKDAKQQSMSPKPLTPMLTDKPSIVEDVIDYVAAADVTPPAPLPNEDYTEPERPAIIARLPPITAPPPVDILPPPPPPAWIDETATIEVVTPPPPPKRIDFVNRPPPTPITIVPLAPAPVAGTVRTNPITGTQEYWDGYAWKSVAPANPPPPPPSPTADISGTGQLSIGPVPPPPPPQPQYRYALGFEDYPDAPYVNIGGGQYVLRTLVKTVVPYVPPPPPPPPPPVYVPPPPPPAVVTFRDPPWPPPPSWTTPTGGWTIPVNRPSDLVAYANQLVATPGTVVPRKGGFQGPTGTVFLDVYGLAGGDSMQYGATSLFGYTFTKAAITNYFPWLTNVLMTPVIA